MTLVSSFQAKHLSIWWFFSENATTIPFNTLFKVSKEAMNLLKLITFWNYSKPIYVLVILLKSSDFLAPLMFTYRIAVVLSNIMLTGLYFLPL